jgi:hypothetical protein
LILLALAGRELLLAALKKSAIERCPCVLRCNGSVDGSEMWASGAARK